MKNTILVTFLCLAVLFSCKDDEKKEKVYTLEDYNVLALEMDGSNLIWAGTNHGLFKQTDGGFKYIDIGTDTLVSALAFDKNENILWIGTLNGLYKLVPGKEGQVEQIEPSNISNPAILAICNDSAFGVWFGTGKGITRTDSGIWQKEKFKKSLSGSIGSLALESRVINDIAVHEGEYFFATAGDKIWRCTQWNASVDAFSGATRWDEPYNGTAINDSMFTVFVDSKGRQWMGGIVGVQVHTGDDPKTNINAYKDELVNQRVHTIAEGPDGKIWIGTENGISVFDGTNWEASSVVLPDPFVQAICIDKNGKAYIGTRKGLVVQ